MRTEQTPGDNSAPLPLRQRSESAQTRRMKLSGEVAAPSNGVSPIVDGGGRRNKEGEPKKKKKIPTLLLALAIVLGAVLIVFASRGENSGKDGNQGKERSAAPAKSNDDEHKVAKIGEPAELAKLQGTVLNVDRDVKPPETQDVPPAGQRFFAVEFKLTNRDDRPVTILATNQFKLRDSTQTRYEISGVGVPQPRFPDGVVGPGQTVQGWISFQIPVDAKKLRLQFNAKVPRG